MRIHRCNQLTDMPPAPATRVCVCSPQTSIPIAFQQACSSSASKTVQQYDQVLYHVTFQCHDRNKGLPATCMPRSCCGIAHLAHVDSGGDGLPSVMQHIRAQHPALSRQQVDLDLGAGRSKGTVRQLLGLPCSVTNKQLRKALLTQAPRWWIGRLMLLTRWDKSHPRSLRI